MIAQIIAAALLVLPAGDTDSDAQAELFDVLDRDQDGQVSSGEISDAQRPYFDRALRVSDANSDGALTRDELTGAVSDPAPRQATGGRRDRRQRRDFDPRRLDQNKDGMITVDEVPRPIRERFQEALKQAGRDALPVEAMWQLMRGNRPQTGNRPKPDGRERMRESDKAGPAAGNKGRMQERRAVEPQLQAFFLRIDVNRDGKVDRREARRFPQFVGRFDRNGDGTVERRELLAIGRDSDRGPKQNRPDSQQRRKSDSNPTTDRPGDAQAMFDRLDRNEDGAISREEAPERMQSRFDRIDGNGDGRITREEFARAGSRQKKL